MTTKPDLYWSQRGEVACEKHAPYRHSDTWKWERWKRMRPEEIAEMKALGLRGCETCCSWGG